MRHKFQIPIGDWSGDGHGKCDWVYASAAKSIEDVREAFYKARELHPDVSPEKYCSKYEDSDIDDKIVGKLKKLNAPCPFDGGWNEEYRFVTSDGLAELVIWYLNLGDPELDAKLENENVPSLSFGGYDDKKRHIDFIGYGLFE